MIQASFSALWYDEAYYSFYAEKLEWGYFDHPPMIALFIYGSQFFPLELSIRFFIVLGSTIGVYFLASSVSNVRLSSFLLSFLSLPILVAFQFLAVPDSVLILWIALFYYFMLHQEKQGFWSTSIIFGLLLTALAYTKYHSILVFFFSLLAMPEILKKRWFYFGSLIALILLIPHLYWQFSNDWVSFLYHFSGRNKMPWKFDFTLEYLLTQIVMLGGPAGLILTFFIFKQKPRNEIEKFYRFQIIGFYVFFLFMSFRGKTEGHWTIAAYPAILLMGTRLIDENYHLKKLLFRLLPLTLIIYFFMRFYFIFPIVPNLKGFYQPEFYKNNEWVKEIELKSGGLPVVFVNSYQKAAMYHYLTHKQTYSYPDITNRKSEYQLRNIEEVLQGEKVFLYCDYPYLGEKFSTVKGTGYGGVINNFSSWGDQHIEIEKVETRNDSIYFDFKKPTPSKLVKKALLTSTVRFSVWISDGIKVVEYIDLLPADSLFAQTKVQIRLPSHKEDQKRIFYFGFRSEYLPLSLKNPCIYHN